MKFFTIITVLLFANAICASYSYEEQNNLDKELTQRPNRNVFNAFILQLEKILNSLKESKHDGQQRMKSVNYGCVWKICSRPLKVRKPKPITQNDIDKIFGVRHYGFMGCK